MAAALSRRSDLSLVVCARRPMDELHVESNSGLIRVTPMVVTQPEQAPSVDWVIVTTKAYDAPGALIWLRRLCADGAPAAILQNGVEHRARFSGEIPPERLVPVVVDCPAERVSATLVRQRGPVSLTVENNGPGRAFIQLFEQTDFKLTPTDDWTSAAWRKLCLNAAGVISALLLQPAGVMRDEELGEVSRQLVREGIAVGRAEGATLDDALVEEVLNSYRQAPPDSVNSLHADRLAGRPTELDARNGAIVRLGQKHGIPTPANEMAVALLSALTTARR